MLTVAYLANEFPSNVEPYVGDEVQELRNRGIRVVAGSVRDRALAENSSWSRSGPEVVLLPVQGMALVRAVLLCLRRWRRILPLIGRIVLHGSETPAKRVKALAHTGLGACYAVLLEKFHVDHIHVHHGYFGSWIAMVAARLLGVEFSMTLHGSDLLLQGSYLDTKLKNCSFCLTISEYNRNFILQRCPGIDKTKVIVSRLGVDTTQDEANAWSNARIEGQPFTLLAVGRLHPVKNHGLLIRACEQLGDLRCECWIAGEGAQRRKLEAQIRTSRSGHRVKLLGHVARERLGFWYEKADVVVLTSRSEGIPLVLMEAMARGKIVLAPAITGIPELVTPGTGFLYEPGSLDDFVSQLRMIHSMLRTPAHAGGHPYLMSAEPLAHIRNAAQAHVRQNFNRGRNLEAFGDLFLCRIAVRIESTPDENFVLQQI